MLVVPGGRGSRTPAAVAVRLRGKRVPSLRLAVVIHDWADRLLRRLSEQIESASDEGKEQVA